MYRVSALPYFDRKPLAIQEEVAADAYPPHATLERWKYTVPVNRQFFLEHTYIELIRDFVAALPARAQAWIVVRGKLFCHVSIYVGTVGANARSEFGGAVLLNPGESVIAYTSDSSADGKMGYNMGFHGTEFDALEDIDKIIDVEPPKPDVQEPEVVKDPKM